MSNSLLEYKELLAVSIGINLAYVAFSKYVTNNDAQTPFFEIVSRYANNAISRLKRRRTKGVSNLEHILIELTYYLDSKILTADSTIIVGNISKKCKETNSSINSIFDDEKLMVDKTVDFKFYSHLSLQLATFGLFLLFIAPLQERLHLDLRIVTFYLNLITIISIVHSSIWEFECMKIKKSKYKIINTIAEPTNKLFGFLGAKLAPKFIFIIFSFAFYIFIFFHVLGNKVHLLSTLSSSFPFLFRNSIVFSIILCFSNFILYFLLISARVEISVIRFRKSLRKKKLEDLVKTYSGLLQEAKDEMKANPLDKITEESITQELKNNGTIHNSDIK
jgi:hypothetical protein